MKAPHSIPPSMPARRTYSAWRPSVNERLTLVWRQVGLLAVFAQAGTAPPALWQSRERDPASAGPCRFKWIRALLFGPGGYVNALQVEGASRLLFISGQIPQTREGHVPDRIEDQCRLVWANLTAALAAAAMDVTNLLKVTTTPTSVTRS